MQSPKRNGLQVEISKKPVERKVEKKSVSDKEEDVKEDVSVPLEKEVVEEV